VLGLSATQSFSGPFISLPSREYLYGLPHPQTSLSIHGTDNSLLKG